MRCVLLSWKDVEGCCRDLVRKFRESKFLPDSIVAIARGGFVVSRIISDMMNVKELLSIKVEHWGITATVTGEAKLTHPLNVALDGKRVLIVDEVTDTGDTMKVAVDHLRRLNPAEVRTAVLDHKLTSKFEPDFYARRWDEWVWIIYPWNVHEDLLRLISEILDGELTQKEIMGKLKKEYDLDVPEEVLRDVLINGMELGRFKEAEGKWRRS